MSAALATTLNQRHQVGRPLVGDTRLQRDGAGWPTHLRPAYRHGIQGGERLQDSDHLLGDFGEAGLRGIRRRFDDQGDDGALPGLDGTPLAGQPGEIGLAAIGCRRQADGAALHMGFGPFQAAAREHRIAHVLGGLPVGDADVEAGGANRRGAGHAHTKPQSEVALRPGRDPGQGLGRHRRLGGREREVRAVAAKREERQIAPQGVGHGADGRGAGQVHCLVAACLDRRRRADDIGKADGPVVRQGRKGRRIGHLGEILQDRHARCP